VEYVTVTHWTLVLAVEMSRITISTDNRQTAVALEDVTVRVHVDGVNIDIQNLIFNVRHTLFHANNTLGGGRVGAAPLDREADSEHEVLLWVRSLPHARMWVVTPTTLRDKLPRLLPERAERLDREAPVEVAEGLLLDLLLVAGALRLAVALAAWPRILDLVRTVCACTSLLAALIDRRISSKKAVPA
jgi:hypothetical protein